ncbi:MAG: histidine kinase [Gemmatimonadota bacterium]
MELSVAAPAPTELAAAFLQAGITVGLVLLCALLYRQYRKPYFAWWAFAWGLYALRLGAIISFLITSDRAWLFWHQVTTGWTALALLWAAIVFSQQRTVRRSAWLILLFPLVWSAVAIYRLDSFLLAAGPAVLFLSGATLWTGRTFLRYRRQVASGGAALLAWAFFLWGLHHLDYPFLRARGAWNPWGYYLDIVFELAIGAGILLLVLEDQHRGLGVLSALSGDLQRRGPDRDVLGGLLERPLTLPAVRGSAMVLLREGAGKRVVRGAGVCREWEGQALHGAADVAASRVFESGRPEIVREPASFRGLAAGDGDAHAYTAALPILRGDGVVGAMIVVGTARDPFAALDSRFLVALGQQVGAALENEDLYRRLESRTEELERLAGRMVAQHEEERRRLSRELHDETAQVFAAVKLEIGMAREAAGEEAAPRLDRALDLVGSGIRAIRDVAQRLRPSLLDDLGLRPALQALADEFGARTRIGIRLELPDALPPLPDETELALFRALQEGLSNVARHADAKTVVVSFETGHRGLVLRIADDGRGLGDGRGAAEDRMGLVGMRERISALGGTLAVGPSAAGGVELRVEVPIRASTDARAPEAAGG